MNTRLCLLLLLLPCTACANRPMQWDRQSAKHYFAAATLADGLATYDALDRGCDEANPLYGDAGKGAIFGLNLLLAGAIEVWGDDLPAPLSYTLGSVRLGAAIHNVVLECQ